MSNTRTLTAIVAVLTAATLVVGVTFAATATTHSAFAYKKDDGKNNGNTITAQINKQRGTQSGFDNSFEQEAENVICTHPGENATCLSEGG